MHQITIAPNDNRDASAVKNTKNLIHPEEWGKFKELLKNSMEKAKSYSGHVEGENVALIERCHDTIMLAGVRGSGKTTFMLSALHHIKEENIVPGLEPLPIIDPTLIEEKVHIFVNVISMVKNKVYEIGLFQETQKHPHMYESWQKSFNNLAEGLPSIDGIGTDGFSSDDWLDSEFVMGNGVRRAHAANTLEKNFHEFIKYSLKLLNKDAFLLCFDDIDTRFDRGWPVLDTIHKYLTTPQLLVVVSGDPQLYSILIRQKQWENFTKTMLDREKKSFQGIVSQLEQQYLLKILKPERRIFLNSLYEKTRLKNQYKVVIQPKKGESEQSIDLFYSESLKRIGSFDQSQQELYLRFLLSLPIRTQQQLLFAFSEYFAESSQIEKIETTILHVFWSDLAENNIDVSGLRNAPQYIITNSLRYLVDNKILNAGYTLAPVFSKPMANGSQFALGTIVSAAIRQNPNLVFDFWIRIGLTRELSGMFNEQPGNNESSPSIQNFITHCSIYDDRPARYVARLAVSYMRAIKGLDKNENPAKKAWHGTLPLYGLARKGKSRVSNGKRIDQVLETLADIDPLASILAGLPLSGATNHKGEMIPVYSFYSLLGVLGELVNVAQREDEQTNSGRVFHVLKKNSQLREYPMPEWVSDLSIPDEDSPVDDIEDESFSNDRKFSSSTLNFTMRFVKWAKQGKELRISPTTLGKIFTRFFYAMNRMDDELRLEMRLGVWIHRMVVAFLNAVVVVESLEKFNLKNISLRLTNPVTSDDYFIQNLKNMNDNVSGNLSFSKWILSCPLWQIYLANKIEALNCFSGSDFQDEFLPLYEYLNQVYVRGAVPKENSTPKQRWFSINNEKDKRRAIQLFKELGLSFDDIKNEDPQKLKELLSKHLKSEYPERSIKINTATGIVEKINPEKIKW